MVSIFELANSRAVGKQEVIPFFPAAYPSQLVEQHQVAKKRTPYSKRH